MALINPSGTLLLECGQDHTRDAVCASLVDLNYERVSMVFEPGTFAVKGSVVDVFPSNHNQPIRLDFFSGPLERMQSFRIDTQRSLSSIERTTIAFADHHEAARFENHHRLMDSAVLSNIHVGDYVVHERHGIGIYNGFIRLTVGDREGEYVAIHFKGADKLYMPLDQIPLIHRYSGSVAHPALNGLHDGQWGRTCQRAHRALQTMATDIYAMFKKRQSIPGFACGPDCDMQLQFEMTFPYTETPDQLAAIRAVKRDMESNVPMDRLVCGDVGFGKTEIIVRAAVKAALNGKQVMVLVPTTILCDQHYHTFSQRCNAIGLVVKAVSRLQPAVVNRRIVQDFNHHRIDILIGTHRLLSADIAPKQLGLVVVDEEQRFGVRHKERLKQLTHSIDILTTSATPIPRTLYLSLTGAKQMSTLKTPPPGRQPIRTIVSAFSPTLIQKHIELELNRGGQVYFLHNTIDELPHIESLLHDWVPQARVRVAHGRMKATELADVMLAFYQKAFDVLLCTTIIENGLDIQQANTIIINRADRLGLSQIHQIRGRVGRCSTQAYAIVLYPEGGLLTDETRDRLQALKEAIGLGMGYQLAMKDLEIRGAGTLLGEKQSGHLTAIGFDLYCKLLDQAIRKVRGETADHGHQLSLSQTPNVFIPARYIPNDSERLAMYQRVLTTKNRMGVKALLLECHDRYGKAPKSVRSFFDAIMNQFDL
jgi:transcription-repair coupling factor (superfamily II helicase)